jgi:aspartyl-tRNA(Asn)/glutamyl-tRNA(Gln) amidotransferase subunit C
MLRPYIHVRQDSEPAASKEPRTMAEQLTLEEVSRVAFLARLELSSDEKSRLTHELNDILGQFARLQELDTDAVPATSHSIPLTNVLREDKTRPSLSRDAATQNAPEKRDGNFIVPQIMEG